MGCFRAISSTTAVVPKGGLTHSLKEDEQMSSFKDIINAVTGRDLEDEAPKKKPAVKTAKKAKVEEKVVKSKVTDDAKIDAFYYAADKDTVSNDLRKALKGESLTDGLKKTLQVLLENDEFRALVADQDGVLPNHSDYYLEWTFVDKDGNDQKKQALALISAGTKLEQLGGFNLELKVVKKRKLNDELIEGDEGKVSEREIENVKNDIRKEHYPAKK
jgi:hypothetical protein